MRNNTRLYGVWATMLSRCRNPKVAAYKNYGERGIRVCFEWEDYKTFESWALANGYKRGRYIEIDRINVNGHYEPSNCRWVKRLNNRNKRNNLLVAAFGETKSLVEWSEDARCVVAYHTLKKRIHNNMDAEKAILNPALEPGKYPRFHMPRWYLAGPMRGCLDNNFANFSKAAAKLRSEGKEVFSPAERDLAEYGPTLDGFSIRGALRADTNWICTRADAVALLPGWERSLGSLAERALAKAIGLQIVELGADYCV